MDEFRMYDSTGKLLTGYAQCWGPVNHFAILDSFPCKKDDRLPINFKLKFEKDINLFISSEEDKRSLFKKASNAEITIVVFYAEWAGWFTKQMINEINRYKEKYKDKHSINVVYVNNTTIEIGKSTD